MPSDPWLLDACGYHDNWSALCFLLQRRDTVRASTRRATGREHDESSRSPYFWVRMHSQTHTTRERQDTVPRP